MKPDHSRTEIHSHSQNWRALLYAGLLIGAAAPHAALAQTGAAPSPLPNAPGAPPAAQAENGTAPQTNQAQGAAPPDYSDALTGDWGGQRTRLYNNGLTFTGVYHADVLRNFSGGIKTGNAYLDDTDLQLAGDGEKLYGLKGSSFFIYALDNDGGHPNESLVGSAGGVDSLEVAKSRPKLFEAWVQQNFLDDRVSILGGLYDTDTEFDITDASVLFLNPTYGTGTEFGDAGLDGPAAFPESSAGGRLLVKPFTDTYVQGAIVGGHPADPGDPNGLRFGYGPHAGVLMLGEAGYRNDDNGHYGVGAYHFTSGAEKFDDAGDSNHRQPETGYYALAEHKLLTDPNDKDRILSGFLRAGWAEPDVSPVNWSWSAGVSATKIIPSRPDGQAGVAIGQSRVSRNFAALAGGDGGTAFTGLETQFEITYADKPLPWLTLQPDLQFTINPALAPGHDDALTGGARATVNF